MEVGCPAAMGDATTITPRRTPTELPVWEKLGREGCWTLETFERGKQENLMITTVSNKLYKKSLEGLKRKFHMQENINSGVAHLW